MAWRAGRWTQCLPKSTNHLYRAFATRHIWFQHGLLPGLVKILHMTADRLPENCQNRNFLQLTFPWISEQVFASLQLVFTPMLAGKRTNIKPFTSRNYAIHSASHVMPCEEDDCITASLSTSFNKWTCSAYLYFVVVLANLEQSQLAYYQISWMLWQSLAFKICVLRFEPGKATWKDCTLPWSFMANCYILNFRD